MTKLFIAIPLLATVNWSCIHDDLESDLPSSTEVRLSASIQADIDGLAGVRLKMTPAPICEGFWDDLEDEEDVAPWSEDLDILQLRWPDGSPYEGPHEYSHLLAETSFVDVTPGCYDVVAVPLGDDGEPLLNCYGTTVPIIVDDYASLIYDPPIYCSEEPRSELDVADGNFAPHIDEVTIEPSVSACEVTKICATARDADYDMLAFEWPQPLGLEQGPYYTDQGPITSPWPTIVEHRLNEDRSVTQCIAVQAHEPGMYDIEVDVYDVVRLDPYSPPVHIEDLDGQPSHASESATLDATLGCDPTGRSAVIMLTLTNDPGLAPKDARTLIDNTVRWTAPELGAASEILVVLDDNHHGEDWEDGEFVYNELLELGYVANYIREPTAGLGPADLEGYDLVWFVNPGYEFDDPESHTALQRYRMQGGALVLQGDDIARFRGNPQYMESLTYLSWMGNGTVACGALIDNNMGENYTVQFSTDTTMHHPMMDGLEALSFAYGNDIDLTRPLGKGEQVLAWASYETRSCVVRTPAIVALDPQQMLPW